MFYMQDLSQHYTHIVFNVSKETILCTVDGLFLNIQGRLLSHFIGKGPLLWKKVSKFTGKRYFVGNSIQTCSPLHRKIRLYRKWHSYLHSALLNLCVYEEINMF